MNGTIAVCCLSIAALAADVPKESPTVAQIQNYVHTVANMDKAIDFYTNAMGLRINAPPFGAAPTDRLTSRPQLDATTNTPGSTFRPTYFRLPGHDDWGLELLQFGNIESHPVEVRIQDPGASMLILRLRNLDEMLGRLKSGGATVVTPGGAPVMLSGSRCILLKDLDGMYIQLEQAKAIPPAKATPSAAPKGNILGAKVSVTVDDTAKTAHFYRDLMGFYLDSTRPAEKSLGQLLGTPGVEILKTTAKLWGTSFEMEFLEFKGTGRRPIHPRMQDPGAPQFTIYFKDQPGAIRMFQQEGTPFLGTSTIWDPNGILILVRAPFPFY